MEFGRQVLFTRALNYTLKPISENLSNIGLYLEFPLIIDLFMLLADLYSIVKGYDSTKNIGADLIHKIHIYARHCLSLFMSFFLVIIFQERLVRDLI